MPWEIMVVPSGILDEHVRALYLYAKGVHPIADIAAKRIAFPPEFQKTVDSERFPLISLRSLN